MALVGCDGFHFGWNLGLRSDRERPRASNTSRASIVVAVSCSGTCPSQMPDSFRWRAGCRRQVPPGILACSIRAGSPAHARRVPGICLQIEGSQHCSAGRKKLRESKTSDGIVNAEKRALDHFYGLSAPLKSLRERQPGCLSHWRGETPHRTLEVIYTRFRPVQGRQTGILCVR